MKRTKDIDMDKFDKLINNTSCLFRSAEKGDAGNMCLIIYSGSNVDSRDNLGKVIYQLFTYIYCLFAMFSSIIFLILSPCSNLFKFM